MDFPEHRDEIECCVGVPSWTEEIRILFFGIRRHTMELICNYSRLYTIRTHSQESKRTSFSRSLTILPWRLYLCNFLACGAVFQKFLRRRYTVTYW